MCASGVYCSLGLFFCVLLLVSFFCALRDLNFFTTKKDGFFCHYHHVEQVVSSRRTGERSR